MYVWDKEDLLDEKKVKSITYNSTSAKLYSHSPTPDACVDVSFYFSVLPSYVRTTDTKPAPTLHRDALLHGQGHPEKGQTLLELLLALRSRLDEGVRQPGLLDCLLEAVFHHGVDQRVHIADPRDVCLDHFLAGYLQRLRMRLGWGT